MLYNSTQNAAEKVEAAQAISQGISKDGGLFVPQEFPKYDVGSNEEMRRRGIRCFKDEDAALHGQACAGGQTDACQDCQFYHKSL